MDRLILSRFRGTTTKNLKLSEVSEFTTSYDFCSCGCGMIVVGQITFWSLLVHLVFRLGDMAIRGQAPGSLLPVVNPD
ncbi:MAG TPA: hypothetical protein VF789_06820 [Thermoanaerobaculia bacterium]